MQISEVRKRVIETIARARRAAADRRTRVDEAGRDYELFLERTAIPVFRHVATVLRAESFQFNVFTPGGGVRLMSEKSGQDYIELALDTSGDEPQVIGHTSRSRGRRIVESERPIAASRAVRDLTEEDVLTFLLNELEAFVER